MFFRNKSFPADTAQRNLLQTDRREVFLMLISASRCSMMQVPGRELPYVPCPFRAAICTSRGASLGS
jgi:hypothetical protein